MRTSLFCRVVALFPAVLLLLLMGQPAAFGNEADETAAPSETAEAPKISGDQLDSLVAPIALYPDPLLAQTLAASTYPIEVMQLGQWLEKNKDLKDQALADAVAKQPWDPSVQAMAAFPEVTQRMVGNIQWTSDMGNAFLAQQHDVMAAVQRMRAKAESNGALKTGEQQKVETKTVGSEQVIVVEQADPSTVYVPSYDPTVVYGEPAVPYPTYTYPGYIAGSALAFGGAMALGAAWGNNWGYGCGWDEGDININNNNNYVKNYNKQNNIKAGQTGQAGKWGHNPQHRGNAPYGDRGTADKFGGRAASGAGGPGRPGGAGGAGGAGKPGGPGGVGKPGSPGGAGGIGKPGGAGGVGKPGGAGGAGKAGGAGGVGKPGGAGGAGPAAKPANRPSSGGADQIGNKNMGNKGSSASRSSSGAISGGSGKQAKASSNRGGKSMGGGGMSGGGGRKGGGGGGRR